MHWRVKLFICVFIIWPAVAFGAIFLYFYKISTPQQLVSVSQITPVVPMKFPNSAQVLDGETVFGPSALYFVAKIKIPRSDFHRFLAQPLLNDGKGLSNEDVDFTEKKYPQIAKRGWKIDSIKSIWRVIFLRKLMQVFLSKLIWTIVIMSLFISFISIK